MKFIIAYWILLTLTACSSDSKTSEAIESAQSILQQYACLEGTWKSSAQEINISGKKYHTSADISYIIISNPTELPDITLTNDNNIFFNGLEVRTWTSNDQQTIDKHSKFSSILFNAKDNTRFLTLVNSCTNKYEGDIDQSKVPQCSISDLETYTFNLTLECNNDDQLSISSNSSKTLFQKIHSNTATTHFNSDSDPIDLNLSLEAGVELLTYNEILQILIQSFPLINIENLQSYLQQLLQSSLLQETIIDISSFLPEEETTENKNDDKPSSDPINDLDNDGISDDLDDDIDGDGYENTTDAFPFDASEWNDLDGDGIGNNSDNDIDGDGYDNTDDQFPFTPSEWSDFDSDGIGDNSDNDIDGDGYDNTDDQFPLTPSEWSDLDNDGIGDNSDDDIDGDGHLNQDDIAPYDPTIPQNSTLIFSQDFQNFDNGLNWYLTDFGITDQTEKKNYTINSEILFNLRWTKRSRKLLADRLGYEHHEMTNELAALLCPPKIEVGRSNIYSSGLSSNIIAELDSDLYHCNINHNEPASLKIHSFIPTEVGYNYRLSVDYKIRSYSNQPINAYRHFVLRFSGKKEYFPPIFNTFETASIEITAAQKFSRIMLMDNGLPDSYGILIDNIKIERLDKNFNYDVCANIFATNTKGFKKCILQQVDTNVLCDASTLSVKYQPQDVNPDRQNTDFLFLKEETSSNHINFLSLGKKGKATIFCSIHGYPAILPIHQKRLTLNEISSNTANQEDYPEHGYISVKLINCDEETLNGKNQIGTITTNEFFSYDFTQNEAGLSYKNCDLKSVTIKDRTPNSSPSTDGLDLNYFNIEEL